MMKNISKNLKKNIDDFILSDNITVGQTREWIKKKDQNAKDNLVKLINHRFQNRYIKHVKQIDCGFLKMAVACITIEALESFIQGKNNTKGNGKNTFRSFFKREVELFTGFNDISDDFYTSIRCGILHQAETINGWRVLRKDALLDKTNKTINATKFVNAIEKSLDNYLESLKNNDINSPIWNNAILKIKYICKNCNVNN